MLQDRVSNPGPLTYESGVDRLVVLCIKEKESAVNFYAPVTIVNGALRFAPVCSSVGLSARSSHFTV